LWQSNPPAARKKFFSAGNKLLCARAPLREDSGVQARFLLGPAGSGKTFRCLAEIRAALAAAPDGPPLILLAPKQATFQLERQLLAGGEIAGFTRLHIFSFDRLAQFVFEELHLAPPKLLSGEGRLMVLRALLQAHADKLKLFSGSARRAGFAQELGELLSELQQHQFGPARLRSLAADEKIRRELRDKLHDLALLAEKYADWLREHELQDANHLLDFATDALKKEFRIQNSEFRIEKLWLDGFAEMTPQELALLAAVIPFCDEATLAFCLKNAEPPESWLSVWSAIGKTFQRCRDLVGALPGCTIEKIQPLERAAGSNRFAPDSDLDSLEESWTVPVSQPESRIPNQISIAACADPEAEAVFAAREILKFVRAGNRFRDCAVLVRTLETHHQVLSRVFRRYEIPFFLDRRESVAHHPLAELTRNALRTVAFDWRADDWFAALKAGFAPVAGELIDDLENRALEFGWRGKKWREPLPDESCERLRETIFPPFENFYASLGKNKFQPTGAQLAEVVREFWSAMEVKATLERWALDEEKSAIHSTVWDQMNSWLDNLALAFPREALPLRDWLPILEAGLGNLTVGVVPPALDEVLIGAVDRARNPDLKFALVLGVNESIFPAATAAPAILTNSDREELENQNAAIGASPLDQISRERYLGYIACTRANQKLALTFARQNADGKTLNPSPFIAQLQRIFPALAVEDFSGSPDWNEAEHASELVKPLLETPGDSGLLKIPSLKLLAEKLGQLHEPDEKENLSAAMAAKIYGPVLKTSISRLEEFAACPFRFFVRVGLHANERKTFELDARERGNFQHDVLKIFHEQVQAEGKRWRDLTPAEARARIAAIAAAQMESHRDGLFRDSAETAFAARAMTAALQDFVEVIVGWMHSQYEFDPAAAELGFGGRDDATPAWALDLGGGRTLALQGRIDRVDLWRSSRAATGEALAVVTDYKSGGKKLEPLLVENGIQLQLLAYLGALRHWQNPPEIFGAEKIIPAGAFYVNLRGEFKGGGSRDEILGDTGARQLAYRHNGRFDAGELRKFDRREVTKGDQFNFRLNKDGGLPSNSAEAIPCKEFTALLDEVEERLRGLGEKIFTGAAEVDPYRKGSQTPCEFCDYRAACRIDEWTHEFRVLRAEKTEEPT
jgi:ATP-dependent helicase/nuclease subunit B